MGEAPVRDQGLPSKLGGPGPTRGCDRNHSLANPSCVLEVGRDLQDYWFLSRELRMKLDEALAIYLFFQNADALEKCDERVLDTAWKVIDQHARIAIETLTNKNVFPRH
jgi:hypothetical protein